MDVTDAIGRRTSIRSFKADPVSKQQVLTLLEKAARAPSGGNLQPWRVYALTGAPLNELRARAMANPLGEPPEYQVYPDALWEPYRRRRFECGEDLYATIAIPRARTASDASRNWPRTRFCSALPSDCSSASTAGSARRNGRISECSCRA